MLNKYPYFSRDRIKNDLSELGAALRKSKGQNFLIDPNSIEKLIHPILSTYNSLLHNNAPQPIIEIGPGLGALTHRFVDFAKIIALEIDPVFVTLLKRLFQSNSNFQIIEGDARRTLLNVKAPMIVGNLPYYISTDLILTSLEIEAAHYFFYLVQSEFAERICASNAISSFTVYVQNLVQVKQISKIPPSAFFPAPKVDSTFFSMSRKLNSVSPAILEKLLRMSYRAKRKKLRNSWRIGEPLLSIEMVEDLAETLNINIEKRPEQIEIEAFHQLAKLIDTYVQKEIGE
ncbi:MAG: ribosomal RNA small subunit methyltransferase A [Leptonema sp. (in: Bacteria)]|nr:ribosomal RNA small subunit methyltransferase A [Leptonema sp. (in: bacteria)]